MLKRFFLSERNMMVAIIINSMLIFLMYFPDYRNQRELELIDHAFIMLFVLEAIIKIQHLGWRSYIDKSWNRFDLAIVLLSLPSVLVSLIPIPDTSILIILRLFRVVRLIRFIRFIPNMGQVMEGLNRALKASIFVLAALFFLNFFLAIVTCHLYGKTAPEFFGDPLISAYSIFQLFTIEGWNDISAEVVDSMDNRAIIWLTRFYLGTVVLIGGIFGMSLANAVFVDEMTIDNNRVLEEKIDGLQQEIQELKRMLARETEDS